MESTAKWPVAAIPFLLLEARAYLEGVGKVVPDVKCQSIAAGATPRHCLASGPLTDRTKTVPNAGQNTWIPDYQPYLTSLIVNNRWSRGDRMKMALYR